MTFVQTVRPQGPGASDTTDGSVGLAERKTILFLTNRVPFPPDKGDKIRTFHQLDHLAFRHDVYCACLAEGRREMAAARSLRRWCRDVAAVPWSRRRALAKAPLALLAGRPMTLAAYDDRRLRDVLNRWSQERQYDVVVAFSSVMSAYAEAVPARRHVLDLCDVDSQKWLDYARASSFPRSCVFRREGAALRAIEESCLEMFDAVILVNDRERRLLDPYERCPNLHVIPNGVDLPSEPVEPASKCGPIVGFFGVMDYRPNVEGVRWFVRHAWPLVKKAVPRATLLVVGRNPVRAINRLNGRHGVRVLGEVRDIRPHLSRCRLSVAPLQIARGLQNKALQAMSYARPVVATSEVAAGLRVVPGHNILVADESETFARLVIDLCEMPSLCDTIGQAGYRCAAAHYSWAEALGRYERILLPEPAPPGCRRIAIMEDVPSLNDAPPTVHAKVSPAWADQPQT